MPSPFPCSPVICECSWSKTQIEKKSDISNFKTFEGIFVVDENNALG